MQLIIIVIISKHKFLPTVLINIELFGYCSYLRKNPVVTDELEMYELLKQSVDIEYILFKSI